MSIEVLPIGKKLRRILVVSSTHNQLTGNPAGIDTEMSSQETKDTPQRMERNDREILPMPRRVRHWIPPDNTILQLNLVQDQQQNMNPQWLHLSGYSPAVYDGTDPVVESSYINYTGILCLLTLRFGTMH